MFDIKRNTLFEDNKINYIDEYDTKCLVKLDMSNHKVLFSFKVVNYPMFHYELTPNTEHISDDFADKYEEYLDNINMLEASEEVLHNMITLIYNWNTIYSLLNIFENIHNEYVFNKYLELIKQNNISFYSKIINKKNTFEDRVVLVGNYLLNYMSDKYDELKEINGNIVNIIGKSN